MILEGNITFIERFLHLHDSQFILLHCKQEVRSLQFRLLRRQAKNRLNRMFFFERTEHIGRFCRNLLPLLKVDHRSQDLTPVFKKRLVKGEKLGGMALFLEGQEREMMIKDKR